MVATLSKADGQLRELLKNQQLGKQNLQRRNAIHQRICSIIATRWPGAKLAVVMYGSSQSGPHLQGSALDLCILDPGKPYGAAGPSATVPDCPQWPLISGLPEWYDLATLAAAIASRAGAQPAGTPACNILSEDVMALPGDRVMLTAKGKGQDVRVELVVNKRLAVVTTSLLQQYTELQDPVLNELYVGVKAWIQAVGLYDDKQPGHPKAGLSSYVIRLITIKFLQDYRAVPDLQCPLLLQQLKTPSAETYYQSDAVQADGGSAWEVRFHSPDLSGSRPDESVNCTRTCLKCTPLGWDFRLFCHASQNPPVLGWSREPWLTELGKGEALFAAGPPNRYGLHFANTLKFDAGTLLADFFEWFWNFVRCDSPFCRHSAILAVNRNAPYTVFDADSQYWAGEPLVVQDPFVLRENVASGVTPVFEKLQREVQRAMRVAVPWGKKWDLYDLLDPERVS